MTALAIRLREPESDERARLWRIAAEQDDRDYDDPRWSRDFLNAFWRASDFSAQRNCVVVEAADVAAGFSVAGPPGAMAFVKPGHEGHGD